MDKQDEAATDASQGPGVVDSDSQECAYCDPETEDCPYCAQNAEQDAEHDPEANGHDPNCPLCAEMAHDPSEEGHDPDCPYCAQNAAEEHNPEEEGHDPDCVYCQQMAESEHDPSEEDHDPDCPYCQANAEHGADDQVQPTDGPTVSEPTTTSGENFHGAGLPEPDLPKPDAISDNPDGLGTSMDEPSVENLKLQSEQEGQTPQQASVSGDAAADETAQDILAQIDAIPGPNPPANLQNPNDPDDTQLAVGTAMEDGVSRPEDYGSNVPGEMGLSEEEDGSEPDMQSVLQEGLDSHADNIQKEKVMQMVGQALDGFKACKDILERSQQQAPQLYQSSIMMLKAMIEMAKMLGLDQGDENEENPLEADPAQQAPPAQPSEPAAPAQEQGAQPPKKALGQ